MPKNTLEEPTLKSLEYNYPVTVQWGRGADTMDYWDNLSIYSIEHFGLPGDRYITDISANDMTWLFKSEADALIFRLRFSEVVD
jgi:hypothetical protein